MSMTQLEVQSQSQLQMAKAAKKFLILCSD